MPEKKDASRWQSAGGDVEFPPLAPSEYLHEWLMDAGPVENGGMGATRLSAVEIEAWARSEEIDLSGNDARLLRAMSAAYAGMLHEANKPDCPPPYATEDRLRAMAAAANNALRSALDAAAAVPNDRRLKR